jgi:hypothetical protein
VLFTKVGTTLELFKCGTFSSPYAADTGSRVMSGNAIGAVVLHLEGNDPLCHKEGP